MAKQVLVRRYYACLRGRGRHASPGRVGCVAEERLPYSVPRHQGPREAYKAVSVVLQHSRGIRRPRLLHGAHFGPRTNDM
jgi:hypothetical protein